MKVDFLNGHRVRIQDKNGVKVRVHVTRNGTWVDADCQCFGSLMRTHSNSACPLLKPAARRAALARAGGDPYKS